MPNEKLKGIGQATFLGNLGYSSGGVCYYMCNFIESEKGPWDQPKTFAAAKQSGKDFSQYAAMMNHAKAKNLEARAGKRLPQRDGYQNVAGALENNQIYRIWVWVGEAGKAPRDAADVNHEIIAVTGAGDEVVYFEPNFGFFAPSAQGASNRVALERFIREQYTANNYHAENFGYRKVRGLDQATPKTTQ